MPPVDPTTDPDFMKAAPHEQMAYLSQTDPEFAKATPQDQMGYLMHIRGLSPSISGPAKPSGDMQQSNLGIALGSGNTPSSAIANPQQPAEQFGLNNPEQQGKLALASAVGAGGAALGASGAVAAGPVLQGLKSMATAGVKALPYVAASEAINYARQKLPGGKYIPPGAEMIPLFMSGAKGESSTNRIAGRAEGATAEELESQYKVQNIPVQGANPTGVQGSIPNLPEMQPAQSTTISQHGYDPDKQQMFVQFKNGNTYRYSGVPQKVYDQYATSESQGSFHGQQIKGRYQTDLVGKVKPTPGQKVSQSLGGQQ